MSILAKCIKPSSSGVVSLIPSLSAPRTVAARCEGCGRWRRSHESRRDRLPPADRSHSRARQETPDLPAAERSHRDRGQVALVSSNQAQRDVHHKTADERGRTSGMICPKHKIPMIDEACDMCLDEENA